MQEQILWTAFCSTVAQVRHL